MSKIKNAMMDYDNAVFQQMQKQLFEELVQHGSPNTEFKPLNPYALGGAGQKVGNNFFSPSTTQQESSAVSKQETLILNAQARPSISTKAKKPKAPPSTVAQKKAVNFF